MAKSLQEKIFFFFGFRVLFFPVLGSVGIIMSATASSPTGSYHMHQWQVYYSYKYDTGCKTDDMHVSREQYQDDNNLFSGDSLHPNCQGDEVQVKRFKMTPNQPISGIKWIHYIKIKTCSPKIISRIYWNIKKNKINK